MKNLFFILIVSLLIVGRLHGQALPTLLEQRKQLLLNSEIRLQQLTEPLVAMSSAKREAEADIEDQIKSVQQSVTESYNQANGLISEKRSQGTLQDFSMLGSTGSLGSGAMLAGLNMLNRKSTLSGQKELNESSRKQAEQQAQAIREKKMATIERQYAEQVAASTRPVVAAMNAFFVNRPPEPRLPGPSTPTSQRFVYMYFGKPFFDRILFSDVWRVDRASDGTWTKIDTGKEPFEMATTVEAYVRWMTGEKTETLIYPASDTRQPVLGLYPVLMNQSADYAYNDTFAMGAFASAEAALQHQISLMQQAMRANVAVAVVPTPPQASLADIRQFTAQQNEYWGVARRAGQVGLAQENRTTQEVAVVRKQSAVTARVEAAPHARVSAGASTKSDDFWGEGDPKDSAATTPASRGKQYRQTDSDLTVRVQIEQDTLEVIESADKSIVPRGIYRRNQRGSYEHQTNAFTLQTNQMLTFTNGHTTLHLTPQP